MRRRPGGFTLIEVMIALAIVSIALVAIMRAVGVSTSNQGLLRDRALALMAAENRLAELQLSPPPPGTLRVACPQGHLRFDCVQHVTRTAPGEYAITVEVQDDLRRRLATLDLGGTQR
ncbi:type II secretion system minor pseudopilin GspI [[Pseudomonas] boreopolis]|jgi:general secretion pathway protein I|uniref:Type II secretion system protein I n=1 Tax=Xanthomonas boreopolis TaxID=86183 RepID=A0A919F873_9XANT|nr:hypothetical protein GCM10009090_21020 [[Pseudomonas] boreopolis]